MGSPPSRECRGVFAGFIRQAMRFREKVWVKQAHEVRKTVVVAMVWRRGQKDDMVGLCGQLASW